MEHTHGHKTHLTQLDKARLAGGAIATILLAGTIYGFATSHGFAVVWAILFLVFGASAVYAFIGLGKATCPECGYAHSGLGLKNNPSIQCKGCDEYFHIIDKHVTPTSDSAIEEFPVFATPCPQDIKWPDGCCVCQAPVTRHLPIYLELEENAPIATDLLTRAATLGTFKLVSKRKFEVQIPLCDQHESASAELEYRTADEQLYISFCSRSYAKAFDATNGPVFWGS